MLNLTSIGGLISIGGFGAYCASKLALECGGAHIGRDGERREHARRRDARV